MGACRGSGHGEQAEGGAEGEGDEEDDEEDGGGHWNLRRSSAAGLDMLSNHFGDDLLPIMLPIVQQRLGDSDWRTRESGGWGGWGGGPDAAAAGRTRGRAAGSSWGRAVMMIETTQCCARPRPRFRPVPRPSPVPAASPLPAALLALGAVSQGCATGLAPYLPDLVGMLLPTLGDARPMVRCIR